MEPNSINPSLVSNPSSDYSSNNDDKSNNILLPDDIKTYINKPLTNENIRTIILEFVQLNFGRISKYEMYSYCSNMFKISKADAKRRIEEAIRTWVSDREEDKSYSQKMLVSFYESLYFLALKGVTTKKNGNNSFGPYWEETHTPDLKVAAKCLDGLARLAGQDDKAQAFFEFQNLLEQKQKYEAINRRIIEAEKIETENKNND